MAHDVSLQWHLQVVRKLSLCVGTWHRINKKINYWRSIVAMFLNYTIQLLCSFISIQNVFVLQYRCSCLLWLHSCKCLLTGGHLPQHHYWSCLHPCSHTTVTAHEGTKRPPITLTGHVPLHSWSFLDFCPRKNHQKLTQMSAEMRLLPVDRELTTITHHPSGKKNCCTHWDVTALRIHTNPRRR